MNKILQIKKNAWKEQCDIKKCRRISYCKTIFKVNASEYELSEYDLFKEYEKYLKETELLSKKYPNAKSFSICLDCIEKLIKDETNGK